jgi:DNA-directed RNA polymerase specialized sigma subunit
MKQPKKPFSCFWISDETWKNLKLKEKDFIVLLYERKFTKSQIARALYLTTYSSYFYLEKSVRKKLQNDVENFKVLHKKTCK